MKHRARWGGLAAVGVSAVLALGACGNPPAHLTTKQGAASIVNAALDRPGLSLRLTLGGVDQLVQGAHAITPKVAANLANAAVVVDVYSGHGESIRSPQFAADADNQLDLAVQMGHSTPLAVRYRAGTLYARADLANLYS